ncbi:MAG TPA: hypothetical protein VIL48_07090 [Acidimicrobiales bacterium]
MFVILPALLIVGVLLTLRTRRFTPHPSLAPVRAVVAGLAGAGALLLAVSVSQVWWVIDDREADEVLTTRGTSAIALLTVGFGLVAAGAAVAAACGRRNWAPLALALTWFWVLVDWYASTGEFHDIDSVGRSRPGLRLMTWGVLLITVAAVVAALARRAERRRAGPGPGL